MTPWRVPLAVAVFLSVIALALWSHTTGGIVSALFTGPAAGEGTLDALRRAVLAWGPVAPLAYLAIVTVEVVVAPIPGAILYAPGGAIFGGLWGGTLSLAGNVIGAALACWLAATFGEAWVARRIEGTDLAAIRDRLRARGAWIVFLLRVNPFTSSDLVSYAAGLAGVPASRVGLGTLLGMAPQCYAQAYLAETIFEMVPVAPGFLFVIGFVIAGIFTWFLLKPKPSEPGA